MASQQLVVLSRWFRDAGGSRTHWMRLCRPPPRRVTSASSMQIALTNPPSQSHIELLTGTRPQQVLKLVEQPPQDRVVPRFGSRQKIGVKPGDALTKRVSKWSNDSSAAKSFRSTTKCSIVWSVHSRCEASRMSGERWARCTECSSPVADSSS